MDNDNNESKYKVTQTNLILRIIIALYVEYIVYSLFENYLNGQGLALPVLIIVELIFGICGLLLLLFSAKALILGEYKGGKADKPDN